MEILRSDPAAFTPTEVGDIHDDMYQSALRLHRTLRNYLLILDLQTRLRTRAVRSFSRGSGGTDPPGRRQGSLAAQRRMDDVTVIEVQGLLASRSSRTISAGSWRNSSTMPVNFHGRNSGEGGIARRSATDRHRRRPWHDARRSAASESFNNSNAKNTNSRVSALAWCWSRNWPPQCKAEFSLNSQPGRGTGVQIAFPPAG